VPIKENKIRQQRMKEKKAGQREREEVSLASLAMR
jgi:hypothetical protein